METGLTIRESSVLIHPFLILPDERWAGEHRGCPSAATLSYFIIDTVGTTKARPLWSVTGKKTIQSPSPNGISMRAAPFYIPQLLPPCALVRDLPPYRGGQIMGFFPPLFRKECVIHRERVRGRALLVHRCGVMALQLREWYRNLKMLYSILIFWDMVT